jgi:hypothetical protein
VAIARALIACFGLHVDEFEIRRVSQALPVRDRAEGRGESLTAELWSHAE